MVHPLYLPQPSVFAIRQGCVLATIVQALWSAQYDTENSGHWNRWWENGAYRIDLESSDIGTVAFLDNSMVGAFFAHDSPRSHWSTEHDTHSIDWYLTGMPGHLRRIAEEILLPFLENYALPGEPNHVTATIWGIDDTILSSDSWSDLFWHGMSTIYVELLDTESALAHLSDAYGIEGESLAIAKTIFEMKKDCLDEALHIKLHSSTQDTRSFHYRQIVSYLYVPDNHITLLKSPGCLELLGQVGIYLV